MHTFTPASLLYILQDSIKEIVSYKKGYTDKEFNLIAKKDNILNKSLLLEIKDLNIITDKLKESLRLHSLLQQK